jgi:hypothetical protein
MRVLTTPLFIEKAKRVHGEKYDYSEVKYVLNVVPITIRCKKHGIFLQKPAAHLLGKGCQLCKNEKLSKDRIFSTKDFLDRAHLIHGIRYDYSGTVYKGSGIPVQIKCVQHGVFNQYPFNHLKGIGCKKCGIDRTRKALSSNKDIFVAKSKIIHGNKYTYDFVNYTNAITKVRILCHKHGLFFQTPNKHLVGRGCPECKESEGEIEIKRYLNKHHVEFFAEKRFSDCRDIKPLSFDFYLPHFNTVIEFDGIQHFYPTAFSYKVSKAKIKENFDKVKKHDKLKEDYCNKKDICLIRISYKDFRNIKPIIDRTLSKKKGDL